MNSRIRSAVKAFLIHLCASALVGTCSALLVLGLWFPFPYRDLAGGMFLLWLLIGVDVGCGPLLTAVLYNPAKSRRELTLDLSIVVLVQLAALVYGVYSISQARPVVLAFEVDRFVAVTPADLDPAQLPEALPQYQSLSWTGPRLVGARDARNGDERLKSVELSLQGIEPSARPGWWQPYEESAPTAQKRMKPLADLRQTQHATGQAAIDQAAQKAGLPLAQLFYLPLTSAKKLDSWIAILDKDAQIVGYAPVDGFPADNNPPAKQSGK